MTSLKTIVVPGIFNIYNSLKHIALFSLTLYQN